MRLDNCYNFENSDYWPHLYYYNHNVSADMFFDLLCFMLNSGVYKESRPWPFIWTSRIDCSDSVTHERVQVLSYSKYFLLFLPVVGIEPATSEWFQSETLSSQILYPQHHVSLSGKDMWQVRSQQRVRLTSNTYYNLTLIPFCRGVRSPNECPGYDSKPSDGEVPVMMELWEMQSTRHCHCSQVHSDPE